MSNFCTGCGKAVNDQQQFCMTCGAENKSLKQPISLGKDASPGQPIPTELLKSKTTATVEQTLATPVQQRIKAKMPMWQKVALSLSFILVVAAVGGHFTIKTLTEPDKTVLPIFNALLDNDESTFIGKLTLPKDVGYDAKSYMDYIKEQKMDRFHRTLQENARDVRNDGITRVINHDDGSELFRMKEKKFLYFYPTVEVIAISTDVHVDTDLNNIKIAFNGEDHQLTGDNLILGSFLPGKYVMEAKTANPIIPHEAEWKIPVSTSEKVNHIPLTKRDVMIELDGDHPDSIVYVNGVSTKKTIAELEQIGPIFGDTNITLTVQKKTPTGETAKSIAEVVSGGSALYFTYPSGFDFVVKTPEQIGEETFDRDKLKQFVIDFRNSYELSLNRKRFSLVKSYLAPESVAYKEIKGFIDDIGNDYYDYSFSLNEVTNINLVADKATVSSYEEFYFTNHLNEVIFYERDKNYIIRKDENGDYKIHAIDIIDTKRN